MDNLLFFLKDILHNGWFYVSLLEFIFIIILLSRKLSSIQKRRDIKREILSEDKIDYNNIIQSSFNSQPLYDSLKKKCHPDRFLNKEQNLIATELFARIVENKYNYQVLKALKEEAENKLKIKV